MGTVAAGKNILTIKNITVSYKDKVVLSGINFGLKKGSVVAILGASGVGKTTLLNVIAKRIPVLSGEVTGDYGKVSYVFQEDRLVPNLTVEQNIRLVNKFADTEGTLKELGLTEAKNLYPKQLSKGMAKRVSLARALSYKGDIMLLDEPFSNLDIAVKLKSEELFKTVAEKENLTAVLVTHDVEEAIFVADEIYILTGSDLIKMPSDPESARTEIKNYFLSAEQRDIAGRK